MIRGRIGVHVALVALACSACLSSKPAASGPASTTSTAVATAPVSGPATPATTTTVTVSSSVFAISDSSVGFTGDKVTVFAQVLPMYPSSKLALSLTRVDFGDGTRQSVASPPCEFRTVEAPQVLNTLSVTHVYSAPGKHEIQMWSVLGCGPTQSTQYSTITVYLYPSAPAAAGWPRCEATQLSGTVIYRGAAMGSAAAEALLRNTSSVPCHLYGYPGLQLVGPHGLRLTSTVTRGSAMTFPDISPHLVGLLPGQSASFDIGYGDNPIGADGRLPYNKACPEATELAIFPPDDYTPLYAATDIAPCGGLLIVSSLVPGDEPPSF